MNSTGPANVKRSTGNRHLRRWLPYVGLVLLVALIVAGLWPRPVPVEAGRVISGPLTVTVNEEGKTRIKQRYVVSAPVAGHLRRIPFKAGAEVQAGQTVIAVIEPLSPSLLDARTRASAEARRDSAAANLEKARAALIFASSELRRFNQLHAERTVSDQELDSAELRKSSALKETSAAESALREAEAELQGFAGSASNHSNCLPQEVKTPASGNVLKVLEESERVVAAGTPLVEIGEPTDLEVVIEVLSRDGAAIVPGARIEFDQWGGTEPLTGRVRMVEPAAFTKVSALGVEEQRVRVIADLLTPPEQRRSVGDSFRVEARIVVWETGQTLKVPAGALFRRGDQWAAFVIHNGRAELRMVEAGRSNGVETQVLKGLTASEEVILYPGSRVGPNQRVKIIKI